MTQVCVNNENKSRHEIKFRVRKSHKDLEGEITYDFIGTKEKLDEFIDLKYRELSAEYANVLLGDIKLFPPDSQLLFGNNQL